VLRTVAPICARVNCATLPEINYDVETLFTISDLQSRRFDVSGVFDFHFSVIKRAFLREFPSQNEGSFSRYISLYYSHIQLALFVLVERLVSSDGQSEIVRY
jgi:hypothetical protein